MKRDWQRCQGGADRSDAALSRASCRPGRTITLFFYDGTGVAGGGLREAALQRRTICRPARRAASTTARQWRSTRAHRHRRRDPTAIIIATARWRWPTRCNTSRRNNLARLTNYGEYLEKHPADARSRRSTRTAPGVARTAWGAGWPIAAATAAGTAEWNQSWRAPLREALDWLRDQMAPRL